MGSSKTSKNNNDTFLKNENLQSPWLSTAPIEEWNDEKVMNWIIATYNNENIYYDDVKLHLIINYTGIHLIKMTKSACVEIDPKRGSWLYEKILELKNKYKKKGSSSNKVVKEKGPGRPKSSNNIKKKPVKPKQTVWEFTRDLLLNPETCPALIKWVDHNEGTFKFVDGKKVAKLWGDRRGNKTMNFPYYTRALRTWYKSRTMVQVKEKLVYKFGPEATGWQTSDPNFLKSKSEVDSDSE